MGSPGLKGGGGNFTGPMPVAAGLDGNAYTRTGAYLFPDGKNVPAQDIEVYDGAGSSHGLIIRAKGGGGQAQAWLIVLVDYSRFFNFFMVLL
jgi:hypothetical protein